MTYLIWSFKRMAWWHEAGAGYTQDVVSAGRYTAEDAHLACDHFEPDEPDRSVMVDAELVYAAFLVESNRRRDLETDRRCELLALERKRVEATDG